jgi:two-component system chemotaxis response regulator CheB
MARVLIVDDSAFMRNAIRQMLTGVPGIEVVGVGRTGREAVQMNVSLKPDVITLDIEMPEMDGLTALQQIMTTRPTAVLMLSSLTTEGSHAALKALALGASDVLAKDSSQISLTINNIKAHLIEKVSALAESKKFTIARRHQPTKPSLPTIRADQFDLVCIGSSTGGPAVLEHILPTIPATIQGAVVVAQHMPALFTASMTDRLGAICKIPVVHVSERTTILPRAIYIAKGGMHMHVRRTAAGRLEASMSEQPKEAVYRPSVDVLFSTSALATKARTLGIVLTGIGCDGAAGAKDIRDAGGMIVAQDEASCVVYGMPKAVTERGLTAVNLPPDRISAFLQQLATPALTRGAA